MWNPNTMIDRGERALTRPLTGGWSPTSRMLMTGLGAGIFIYGLTRSAPLACVLGTLGALMVAEGVTNADLSPVARKAMDVGMNLGTGGMAGMARRAADALAHA